MHITRFRSAALLALAAVVGCADSTGAEVVSGSYVLASIADRRAQPLVISEFTHPNGHRRLLTMLYDSLVFTSDTTVQRSWSVQREEWYPGGVPVFEPLTASETHPGLFARVGDRIVVRTMPGFPPIPTDTFYIRSGTLVRTELTGFGCQDCPPPVLSEFVYERD